MKLIQVTPARSIRVPQFRATPEQGELIHHAIQSFGFLLIADGPKDYDMTEFADIIMAHYDIEAVPQAKVLIRTLLDVQLQSETTLH